MSTKADKASTLQNDDIINSSDTENNATQTTRNTLRKVGRPVEVLQDTIAIPTCDNDLYRSAFMLGRMDSCHMILLKGCDVSIVDGHADDDEIFISKGIYMRYDRTHANLIVRNHGKERYIEKEEDLDPYRDDDYDKVDLRLLRIIYTHLVGSIQTQIKNKVFNEDKVDDFEFSIYVRHLIANMGYSQYSEELLKHTLDTYKHMVGLVADVEYPIICPVLRYAFNNDGTLTVSSPYFNWVIALMYTSALNNPIPQSNKAKSDYSQGNIVKPTHSYLLKSCIASEASSRIIDLVCAMVSLIERAGIDPHVKLSTLIDESPALKQALDKCSNKEKTAQYNNTLQRALSGALRLLLDPKVSTVVETYGKPKNDIKPISIEKTQKSGSTEFILNAEYKGLHVEISRDGSDKRDITSNIDVFIRNRDSLKNKDIITGKILPTHTNVNSTVLYFPNKGKNTKGSGKATRKPRGKSSGNGKKVSSK